MASNPDNSWVIRRKGQYNDYWSASDGGRWAAYDEATLFDDATKNVLSMTTGEGYWSQTHRKQDEK